MMTMCALAVALALVATPQGNVRVRVTHELEQLDDRTRIGLSAGADAGGVHVGVGRTPPPRGVDVRAEASRGRTSSRTEQEILVMSGGRAEITVAEQVPYEEWFRAWGGAHGLWAPTVQWRDVGTALSVEPVVLGDGRVRVRVTPSFSYFVDRERLITRVQQLATEVVVREGETVDLGGLPASDTAFRDRFLLGYDAGRTVQRVRLSLRATVE
jgi:hypothetical protein